MTDAEKKKYEDKLSQELSGLKELDDDELKKARKYFDTQEAVLTSGAVGNLRAFDNFSYFNPSLTFFCGAALKGVDVTVAGVNVLLTGLNWLSTGLGLQTYGLDTKTWGKARSLANTDRLQISGSEVVGGRNARGGAKKAAVGVRLRKYAVEFH